MRLASDVTFHCFDDDYEVVACHELDTGAATYLPADHRSDEPQSCRFCPNPISFSHVAHAVAQLLGNRSVLSLNECDACNKYFRQNESQLAIWFGPARALGGVNASKGVPGFANAAKTRIKNNNGHTHIDATTSEVINDPSRITLGPQLLTSDQYSPVQAAMALIKMACSIAPTEELPKLGPTIDWIRGRSRRELPQYPLLFAFAPGKSPFQGGRATLWRRMNLAAVPYLWCIISVAHFRFQFYLPFCEENSEPRFDAATLDPRLWHHPLPLEGDWSKTELYELDWSSADKQRQPWKLTAIDGDTAVDLSLGE